MREPKEQRAVQSIEVGGRLLLALSKHSMALTLKDLAAEANLPASRAHPYLVSFSKLGLIEQSVDGRYALGPAALQLGLTYLHQLDSMKPLNQAAEALAQTTGQAVAIAVWGNLGPTVVRLIEARRTLHIALRPGTVVSLLGTATGKCFAVTLPRNKVKPAIESQSGASLGHSALRGNLDGVLDQLQLELANHGMTRAQGHPQPGINAFSAPVYDQNRQVMAVLTLIGHEDELGPDWAAPAPSGLLEAAREVGRRLGHFV